MPAWYPDLKYQEIFGQTRVRYKVTSFWLMTLRGVMHLETGIMVGNTVQSLMGALKKNGEKHSEG